MLRARVGFHVDETHKIVTVRYIGAIDGDEIVPQVLDGFAGLERPWDYDCIWDMTRHQGRIDIRDNEILGRGWQELCGGRDTGRRTAVVSSDALIDARLTVSQRLFPFRTIALFGTLESARAWLGEPRADSSAA